MGRIWIASTFAVVIAAWALAACQGPACIPGRQTSCACPAGLSGVQVCADDGTFGECDCTPVDPATTVTASTAATGSGGAGGTAASTSSTGGTGGTACSGGQTLCGEECVNLQSDEQHCGMCDSACPNGASCQAGSCVCPSGQLLCGGVCIDVSSDMNNCGACGRDCLGATCAAGLCEAQPMATLQQEAYALATDATHLYMVSGGTNNHVARVPLNMGTLEVLQSGQALPRDVATGGLGLVWTNKGVGVSGGEVINFDLANQSALPVQSGLTTGVWAVAVNGDYVYWTNQENHTVSRSDMSVNQTIQVLATSAFGTPWDLAVDATHVYFTNYSSGDVRRVPVDGGTQDQLATGLSNPTGIAIDATHVYWTEEGSGRIARVKLGGGTVEEIATNQTSPAHLVVDGPFVYWTNYVTNGTVMRASVSGGDVVTLADKQDKPYAIVARDGYVYWSNFAGGQVMRVAK